MPRLAKILPRHSKLSQSMAAPVELTIASASVTVTGFYHTIDTESDTASDAWTTVAGLVPNARYFFRAANDARTVVVTSGVTFKITNSFSLNDTDDWFECVSDATATYLYEVDRSNNA